MAPIILSDAVGPDTLIRVFNQEFHVHSTVLKIQCEFFKLFMDSPNKVAGFYKSQVQVRVGYEGRCRWRLVAGICGDIEGGGRRNLSLASASFVSNAMQEAKAKGIALLEYEGVISIQIKALYMILLSIYNQSFVIERWTHLARAVELANYYEALPALSNMLYASIPRNHWFINQIPGMAEKIVLLADKMQNAQLFRECMVHLMGPWHNPAYQWIENEQTRELATDYYAKLDDTVYDLLVAIDKSTNPADCKIMKE